MKKMLLIAVLFTSCTHSYYRQQVQLYDDKGKTYIREVSPQFRVKDACPVSYDSPSKTYTICKTKPIRIKKTATFLVK